MTRSFCLFLRNFYYCNTYQMFMISFLDFFFVFKYTFSVICFCLPLSFETNSYAVMSSISVRVYLLLLEGYPCALHNTAFTACHLAGHQPIPCSYVVIADYFCVKFYMICIILMMHLYYPMGK